MYIYGGKKYKNFKSIDRIITKKRIALHEEYFQNQMK